MTKIIGLTGGIGSGKSVCAKCFDCLGVPIYYADNEAKRLMVSDPLLIQEIKDFLGEEAYLPDNQLNKQYISQKIFSEKSLLEQMNAAVHPAVNRDFNNWASNRSVPYVIQENALIADSKRFEYFDKVIVVISPINLRIERLLKRDGSTKETILAKMKNQASDEQRLASADYIIHNDYDHSIINQCIAIYKQLNGASI